MILKMFSLMKLTFKEGARERAIFGIGLFALLMMGASFIIVNFFMRDLHKVAVDINLSAIGLAGLLLTFFVSINLLSKDIDKHTIYCVLSKPFSRSQYIWGKYLGIMLIISAAFLILTVCSSINILLIKSQYAVWFQRFSWMEFYKAVYASLVMFFLLNAIVIFYSTITTSSFLTLLFSISTYIAGQTIEEVVIFLKTSSADEMALSGGVQKLIGIAQYILPNLSVFDLKVQASHAVIVSNYYMMGITLYSAFYSAILICSATLIFKKRELM